MFLLALLACQPDEGICSDAAPELALPAELIDFGEVSASSQSVTARFSLMNTGGEPLEIEDFGLRTVGGEPGEAAGDFTLTAPPSLSIHCDGESALGLTFSPESAGEHAALLSMTSNDPDQPLVELTLLGVGVEDCAEAPVVSITAPVDGAVVAAEAEARLQASVSDDCDPPQSMTVVWYATSAEGGRVYLDNSAIDSAGVAEAWSWLPAGEVSVEAQVVDSWGMSGADSVEVTVLSE